MLLGWDEFLLGLRMKLLIASLLLISISAGAKDLPDPSTTPGVLNSHVTQANIKRTICVKGWTATIRPPVSYTNALKIRQLKSGPYRSSSPPRMFEEDHLISLELGGDPRDERNLWPEHWSTPNGAHQKDTLENFLHAQVCSGKMTLAQAQKEISQNWLASFHKHNLH